MSFDTGLSAAFMVMAVVNLVIGGDPSISMGAIVASLVVVRTRRG